MDRTHKAFRTDSDGERRAKWTINDGLTNLEQSDWFAVPRFPLRVFRAGGRYAKSNGERGRLKEREKSAGKNDGDPRDSIGIR